MPELTITVSGESNSSASGKVTDPVILQKVRDVMQHLEDGSFVDPKPTPAT